MLRRTLVWDDLKRAPAEAFNIWEGQPEAQWAKDAWEGIVRAGLAQYANEMERAKVCIRFMAMASLYHDFCAMAWDERVEPELTYWAAELDVTPVRIGQLIGQEVNTEKTGDGDLEYEETLKRLVNDSRPIVLKALLDRFGGNDGLFLALWKSKRLVSDDDDNDETDEEIVNDPTPDKMAAYEWITEECPEVSYLTD